MSNDNILPMQENKEDSQFRKAMNEAKQQEAIKEQEEKDYKEFIEKYNQDRDADLSGIKMRGRHFLFKAPKKEKPSGLYLPGNQSQQKVSGVEGGSFDENIKVLLVDEKCEKIEQGDQVVLSPHYQALKVELPAEMKNSDQDEELVLYALVHEDYVLMTKNQS